jgi:hypothetical protein
MWGMVSAALAKINGCVLRKIFKNVLYPKHNYWSLIGSDAIRVKKMAPLKTRYDTKGFHARINQSMRAITGTRRSTTTIPQFKTTAPKQTMAPLAIGPSGAVSSANWSRTTTG